VLAGAGASVVVLERSSYDGLRIGETLPPEVRLPLTRLGMWDGFLADGHVESPGIVAAWGSPEPYANDFILNPYGCGWRVDRNRFDAGLAARAAAAGAVVRTGTRVGRCERSGPGWTVDAGPDAPIRAGFLLDATGRARSRTGARRVVHDRMVAVVGVAPAADEDARALIEATDEGWWYSARLPDGRLVMTFQTDARPGLRSRWADLLAAAPATAARAGGPPAGVRVVSANSDRSDPMAGERWLAVGDAAAAHDPIAGLGILWALESGIAGAEAMLDSTVDAYAQDTRRRFDQYVVTRAAYYRAEERWPDAPFWSRRRAWNQAPT
jgi:flavin-dependent dehydrogenase